jgi:hypothetical protein
MLGIGEETMFRLAWNVDLRILVAGAICATLIRPAIAVESAVIPNFAPDNRVGWVAGVPDGENPVGQDFLRPPSGPGPVTFDKRILS